MLVNIFPIAQIRVVIPDHVPDGCLKQVSKKLSATYRHVLKLAFYYFY